MEAEKADRQDIRKQFEQAGFEIIQDRDRPGKIGVKKLNCLQFLERAPEGAWVPFGPPYFIVRGLKCELEDRGYQKFWYSNGQRSPIRLVDLKGLHLFDEEVRVILGLKSLYNESLGTTCARSVYDRLNGRPDK